MSTRTELGIDFETYSEVDLRKVGLDVYANHWSTYPLLIGFAIDDERATVVDLDNGEPLPPVVVEAIRDPSVVIPAWNAPFERAILRACLGFDLPPERFRCSMALAHTLSLPGALDKVGEILGLDDDQAKIKDGKRLIQKFCKPRKPTKHKQWTRNNRTTDPEDWENFAEYCRRDVESERALRRRMTRFDMPPHEWGYWFLDQRINDRGLPISRAHATNALEIADKEKARLIGRAKVLTGLGNPNSGAQMIEWLGENGVATDNMRAETVSAILDSDLPDATVREVLECWASFKKTSVSKYDALLRATGEGDRLRGCFQFAGAGRTWREAGRIFQPQNLPRPGFDDVEFSSQLIIENNPELLECLFGDVMNALASSIRSSIRAPDGRAICVADLNAIENRILGWMTQCGSIMEVFRAGLCPYKSYAVHLLDKPYDQITKAERTFAKPPVLGGGYMLGAKTLVEYAASMGVTMTLEEATVARDIFRDTYPEVVEFWSAVESAFRECIIRRCTVDCWPLVFEWSAPLVRMWLPSGRSINYVRPRIEPRRMPWGQVRPAITYEGVNQKTRKWNREQTHPGKVTENADQGIGRDILFHGMTLADADPMLEVVGHVHDEVISLIDPSDADEALRRLNMHLSTPAPWAPDLPLGSEGYVSPVYKKD